MLRCTRLRPLGPRMRPVSVVLGPARFYANSPFPIDHKKALEKRQLDKLPWYKQWARYFETIEFKRKMTKYYLGSFGVLLVAFYYYMRDRYYEEKQLRHIRVKYLEDPASLIEYEYLKLKAFSNENLKPKEEKKFRLYQMMRKEFRRKNMFAIDTMFEPTPEDLEEWYGKQARKKLSVAIAVEEDEKEAAVKNASNPHVVPAQDTTEFYDKMAAQYDDEIKWEERGMLMGRRRLWLMSQCEGDVLEVACGTGRNIPYFDPEKVHSITFMDSSQKMVEETQKKFSLAFPKFTRAAYTVGKAENLDELASSTFRYDTVIEAFGLCAHEDPVEALKNMVKLLKPGGRLVLLEHGRSKWDFVNNHLDFRAEKRMKTWACRWNLDIGELIDDAGLDITYEKRVHLGSTWMVVCKRPEDSLRLEEKPFINKLFGTEVTTIDKN